MQAIYFGTAAAQRNESVRNTSIANRKLAIDVGLFVEYLAAVSLSNDTFAGFLLKRFPPRLKTAVDAWLETKPFKNPDAPVSPFAMDDYRIEEEQKASRLVKRAEEDFDKARQANQAGDNYVLLTVIFASVLFFAGVGMKFESFSLRVAMLSLATTVFVVAVAGLSGFPVH